MQCPAAALHSEMLTQTEKIDDWDAVLLARYLASWDVLINLENADMNDDGEIDEFDYVIMSKYLVGWYSSSDSVAKQIIHVDVNGSDETGTGSVKAPFKTIEKARDTVASLVENGAAGTITVYIHEGEYFTENGILFEEKDGGNDNVDVVYRAYMGEKAVITGSKTLDKSFFLKADDSVTNRIRKEEARDRIYVCDLAAAGISVDSSDEYFKFYYADTMMDKARYPDRNFDDLPGMYLNFIRPDELQNGFYAKRDVPVEAWQASDEILVRGFISVDYFTGELSYLGYEKASFKTGSDSEEEEGYKINVGGGTPNNNLLYYFHNIFEELDFRGEYYIDKEKNLLYVYASDDFDDIEITYTSNKSELILLRGADHITFDGLIFQGGKEFGIRTDTTSSDITIQNCIIRNISNNGIKLIGNRNTVDRCHIYNLGGYGVQMDDLNTTASLVSSYNRVTNNEINNCSLVNLCYNPGIFANGNGTLIAHNYLHDITHASIQADGPDIVIEYNHLEGCCYQGGDAGAIYTGGFDPMYIRYNFFDYCVNKLGGGGPRCLYIDGGGGCKVIMGNIVVGCTGYGLYAGGGHGNILTNNIVVGSVIRYEDYSYYNQGSEGLNPFPNGYYWSWLFKSQGEDDLLWGIRHPYSWTQVRATNMKDVNEKYRVGSCGGGMYTNNVTVYENPGMPGGVSYTGGYFKDLAGPAVQLNGTVKDNVFYYTVDEVGFEDFENGNLNLKSASKIFSDIPGFKPIPFDLIGIEK